MSVQQTPGGVALGFQGRYGGPLSELLHHASSSGTVLSLSSQASSCTGSSPALLLSCVNAEVLPTRQPPRGGRLRLLGCWAAPTLVSPLQARVVVVRFTHAVRLINVTGQSDSAYEGRPSRGQLSGDIRTATPSAACHSAGHSDQAHLYLEMGAPTVVIQA